MTETQRRSQVESVLDPRRRIKYPGLHRAVDLAIAHRWNVEPAEPGMERADYKTRTIYSTPIVDEAALAVYAHEAGHLESVDRDAHRYLVVEDEGGGRWRESLEGELAAWRWSMRALGRTFWGAAAQSTMTECLHSYQRSLVRCVAQREIIEAVLEEGRFLAGGAVSLRPRPSADISQLREFREGGPQSADVQRIHEITMRARR